MGRFWRKLLSLSLVMSFVYSVVPTSGHADNVSFSEISKMNKEVFHLGDSLKIQTSMCYSSKKPTALSAKKKLQIYVAPSWRNAGNVKFLKSNAVCGNKTPYLQIFEWKVDRLGEVSDGRGSLRLRDTTTRPFKYANVYLFESSESALKWNQKSEYEAEQGFKCLISGGQMDWTLKVCIGGSET